MKTQTQIDIPEKFYITYYAKKHKKFITRKGQYSHPDNIFAEGKYFISKKGEPCFVYWDCDVEDWRMATWSMTLKERHD
jgi:hypothetical protein